MGLKILLVVGVFVFLMGSFVSACGWFVSEDNGTRCFYDAYDNIQGVEDSVLVISRLPNINEIEKNVYMPMNYNG